MKDYIIGVDIGGTNTKIGLIHQNSVIADDKFPTSKSLSFSDYIFHLYQQMAKLIQSKGLTENDVLGIGIGAPNGNALNGFIENPPNLKQWGTVNFLKELSKHTSLPLFLDNDANVAALGEYYLGAGKGVNNFIVATLGTGVGTGIFTEGNLLRGHNGLASEGGHICIDPKGRKCGCGGIGHLEMYASVKGIKQTYLEMTGDTVQFGTLLDNLNKDDELAKEAFRLTAEYLAQGLASMGSLFAPQKIILAGGIAMAGPYFSGLVKENYEKYVFNAFKNLTEIAISPISTSQGAILGAACLVSHFNDLTN